MVLILNFWRHTFSVAEKDMFWKDFFYLLLGQGKKILFMSVVSGLSRREVHSHERICRQDDVSQCEMHLQTIGLIVAANEGNV